MSPLCFRTTSAKLIDLMINHPDCRPTIEAGDDRLYSENLLADSGNIVLAGEGGCAVFLPQGPGVYKGHILLLKDQRGKAGLAFGNAALDAMFGLYEASTVVASVPLALSAARMYVRKLGFSSTGEDGLGHELFVMEKPNG